MKCSSCNVDLVVKPAGPVKADECPECGRVWYEEEELRQAKDAFDGDLNWLDFELWTEWGSLDLKPGDMPCPSCGEWLVAILYGNTGVEVDCCPRCRGFWLDIGDFADIVEALRAELLDKPVADYIKSSLEEAKEIILGPESVEPEWNDFKTVLRLMQYRLLAENPRLAQALSDIQASGPR